MACEHWAGTGCPVCDQTVYEVKVTRNVLEQFCMLSDRQIRERGFDPQSVTEAMSKAGMVK